MLVDPNGLDDARRVMYDELADAMGEDRLQRSLETHLNKMLTELYDRRDEIREAVEPEPTIVEGTAVDETPSDDDADS